MRYEEYFFAIKRAREVHLHDRLYLIFIVVLPFNLSSERRSERLTFIMLPSSLQLCFTHRVVDRVVLIDNKVKSNIREKSRWIAQEAKGNALKGRKKLLISRFKFKIFERNPTLSTTVSQFPVDRSSCWPHSPS